MVKPRDGTWRTSATCVDSGFLLGLVEKGRVPDRSWISLVCGGTIENTSVLLDGHNGVLAVP